MLSSRRWIAVLLAGAVAFVPACARNSAPSQAEYLGAADGVCRQAANVLDKLEEDYEVARFEAEATGEHSATTARPERWVRVKVVPAYRGMVGSLRSIQPPKGDEKYMSDLFDDLDSAINDLYSRPSRGRAHVKDDEKIRNRFEDYGMQVCGTV